MKVTVIGAGVVGMAVAYELVEKGVEVSVVDSGAVGTGASAGNAGWITPFLSTPRAAPGAVGEAFRNFTDREGAARMAPHIEVGYVTWLLKFLMASNRRRHLRGITALQNLAAQAPVSLDSLEERGVQFEEHRTGLAVAFKDTVNLTGFQAQVDRMAGLGFPTDTTVYRGRQVREFDPALSTEVNGVLHLENERHVRPETLSNGLADAVRAAGGTVVENDEVTSLWRESSGTWQVTTMSGKIFAADTVVLAAGVATRKILKTVGVDLPVEAAKGTSMTAKGAGTAPSHALKLYENMVACSPFDGGVRLSGTFDIGDRTTTVDRKRLEMVVRQGLTYLEDWEPADVEIEWAGHRPTTIDDTPAIGPVEGQDGLYVATGHGTLGVTLGPVTGKLAAAEIAEKKHQPLLDPFRLTRF